LGKIGSACLAAGISLVCSSTRTVEEGFLAVMGTEDQQMGGGLFA
jgi:ABC-type uncharacterized transport system substrate-binding protein